MRQSRSRNTRGTYPALLWEEGLPYSMRESASDDASPGEDDGRRARRSRFF